IATLALKLSLKHLSAEGRTGTFVTFDRNSRALYFSRALIPNVRDKDHLDPPIYRHIGVYGYRPHVLAQYLSLAPTPLEQVEKLEQLRALENGIPIDVVPVESGEKSYCSVDTPEDAKRVEEIIAVEGEILD
ncbi:MAG: hypothetical protein KDD42_04285, partial [Bdellovibrionales bacterium]|nr:hypothetical protein [Bdellovibrionales bacterium]